MKEIAGDYNLEQMLLDVKKRGLRSSELALGGIHSGIYVRDWQDISRRYRASKGWQCEDCSKDCFGSTNELHTSY